MPRKESLATREQRRAVLEEFLSTHDLEKVRQQLDVYGRREVWAIVWTCSGCDRRGGILRPAYTLEEAEAVSAAQNRASETEPAQHAASWRDEVARRAIREALSRS